MVGGRRRSIELRLGSNESKQRIGRRSIEGEERKRKGKEKGRKEIKRKKLCLLLGFKKAVWVLVKLTWD